MNSPDQQPLWYPYAQMKTAKNYWRVASAQGIRITLEDGRELVDGISSWWCAIHGYNHPDITAAAKEQLDKVAHVMLGGLENQPARRLAEKLVEITPAGMNHVFFSDSGSVGVEVALKMGIQYWVNQGFDEKIKILSLTKSYHGDTFKTMAVGSDMSYHKAFSKVLEQGYFVQSPQCGFHATNEQVQPWIDQLEDLLKEHHQEIAAFIVEPLLQAAGGFNLYPVHYLQEAARLCKQYNVLLIFDEVATGFGRTGALFAADKAQVTPDIMILSKALTAGYVGHAATVATTEVFNQFYGDDFDNALMHGPTFMGNALACNIALKSIEVFQRDNYLQRVQTIENILQEVLPKVSGEAVKDVRILGAMGCVEVHDAASLVGLQEFAVDSGVWIRPYENYVYLMPAYIIQEDELRKVLAVIADWFAGKEGVEAAKTSGQNDFAIGID